VPVPTLTNCLELPLFNLWFGDRVVLTETFQYVLYYTWAMGGCTVRDKKYMTRVLVKVANGMFGLGLVPLDVG
jgi:hypothetical protein